MMHAVSSAFSIETTVPAKVQAAQQFAYYASSLTQPQSSAHGGPPCEGRKLSAIESRAYDAAIGVLLEYFNEPGFGISSPPVLMPDDDHPEEKVPVEV